MKIKKCLNGDTGSVRERKKKQKQKQKKYKEEWSGNIWTEGKNVKTKILKYWGVGFNSRMGGMEERIHETDDKTIETTYSEQGRENTLEKK